MAKKFDFRLASVLKYREMLEKEKLKEFAQANKLVEEQKAAILKMDGMRRESMDEVAQMYENHENFRKIVETHRYMNTLELGMSRRTVQMIKYKEQADKKRTVLVKARKDKRVLELLEERQKEAFDHEQAVAEQNELDELAVQAWRRRKEQG